VPFQNAVEPVVLEGRYVRLEPLTLDHANGLLEAAKEPSIWTYLVVPQPKTVEDIAAWIQEALSHHAKGVHLSFAVIHKATGKVVGSTRFLDIRPFDGSVEIGWTWYSAEFQRTVVNTECKYVLMTHAFETWGCNRVQLKTDELNEKSRRAIERIGGHFEGILRKYQRYWHGRIRNTAMYSILDEEWPGVKANLERFMAAT
jgi:RimJ/RimL family protein N-acetyltransferase